MANRNRQRRWRNHRCGRRHSKVTGSVRQERVDNEFSNDLTEAEKALARRRQGFARGSVTENPLTVLHADGVLTDVLYKD